MSLIVGDKSNFAIEYVITVNNKFKMGKICLWLGNSFVGFYDEETPLVSVLSSFLSIIDRLNEIERSDFTKMTKEKIFEFMYTQEINNGTYFLGLGETFDDFSSFVYKNGQYLHFFWKLREKPYNEYENYPKCIQTKCVYVADFIDVVSKFKQNLV